MSVFNEDTRVKIPATIQFLRIMFIDGTVPQKHIMRYPQFFATRKIIERLEGGGKGGIIWHTQGSGKTGLEVFQNKSTLFYEKIQKNLLENQELASFRDFLLPLLMNGQIAILLMLQDYQNRQLQM